MSVDMLLDYLAIRLNGERAAQADIAVTLVLSDLDERYAIEVANGVLNYTQGRDAAGAQLTVTTSRGALMELLAGGAAAARRRCRRASSRWMATPASWPSSWACSTSSSSGSTS